MDKAHRDETLRHRLVDTYLELLKTKKSEDISVTDITRAAGVSRMTFYRKFTSKEDMIDFYLGGIMRWEVAWDDALGDEGSVWDFGYGVRFFEAMKRHREAILLLVQRGYASLLLDILNQTNMNVSGDMPSGSIYRYKLYFLAGASFNAMLIWLQEGCRESPEELTRALMDPADIQDFTDSLHRTERPGKA